MSLSCSLYSLSVLPFLPSHFMKILCLNVCQGMNISWIDIGCQYIIYCVILYTVTLLIIKISANSLADLLWQIQNLFHVILN